MSKVTEYLATIILPSLLVDEVKNVLHLEKESIRKINDDMRNIRHKISKKKWNSS